MDTLKITVGNETEFRKIIIGENITKLAFEWGKDLQQWHKESLLSNLRFFLFDILQKNKTIKILDLSHLEGLKESYYPATYLSEIYYPNSVESVRYYKNRFLEKVHAPGAKSITIHQVPTLKSIDFGTNLEDISLTETGITKIELPKNIKLVNNAFKGCDQLKTVILKSGTDIPPSTFEGCTSLNEITLPDDLLVLEPDVFKDCTNLRFVYGGKAIKQLFPSAFQGCINLQVMECKNFYKYTDLSISDKQWLDKFRPYKPLTNVKAYIKKFAQELIEKEIDSPEEYIANNFFHEREFHFGFVMEYQVRIRGWMVWSLSHVRFLATKGNIRGLHQDDLVTFTIERKPIIKIKDYIYFKFTMMYIDDTSSLKIIERNGDDSDGYEYILEYFKPRISLLEEYREILNTIEALDIQSIIDSYFIIARTWWQTYPGRDDSQFFERIAKSDYSDVYLETLLPQEKKEDYYNGCRPLGFDEEKETMKMQALADSEAERLKEYAHVYYSKDEHVCKLLEDYINRRRELERDIESIYHIQAIKNFLHCRYVEQGEGENSLVEFYGYTLEDILKDKKYNEQLSWSYKHGWVVDSEES